MKKCRHYHYHNYYYGINEIHSSRRYERQIPWCAPNSRTESSSSNHVDITFRKTFVVGISYIYYWSSPHKRSRLTGYWAAVRVHAAHNNKSIRSATCYTHTRIQFTHTQEHTHTRIYTLMQTTEIPVSKVQTCHVATSIRNVTNQNQWIFEFFNVRCSAAEQ